MWREGEEMMERKKLVAEWLDRPHDEKSILVIQAFRVTAEEIYWLKKELEKFGVHNLVLFMNARDKIRFVSEKEMNEYRWYKRASDED